MDREAMLNRMRNLCARGERCSADIRRKLADLPPDEAEAVLDTLVREGYVDDARYARAFARDKSALQGWGSLKIKLALQRKGIGAAAIAAAIGEIDAKAAGARMEQVLRAKWKALDREANPARKEAKFYRYALARGYGYEEIKRMYDHFRRS